MEGSTIITGWMIQNCKDVQSIQADLQIQCNPKWNPRRVFLMAPDKLIKKIHM